MKRLLLFIIIAAAGIFFACENFDYFESEKELENRIQNSWVRIQIPRDTDHVEVWRFAEGSLTKFINNNPVDSGTYSIKTTVDDATLKMEGCTDATDNTCNGSWDIVRLDGDVMILATERGGILQREFVKQ